MITVTVNGTPRADVGKKATKAVFVDELIPCVLYGGNQEPVHFTTTTREVRDLIYTPEFKVAEVKVDGKAYNCIIKEIQFHPVKDSIRHIDFLMLEEGRTIKVNLPIIFEGTSPGVRNGGKFVQKVRTVSIKTKSENLVDKVIADISNLRLGQSIRVKDIAPIKGVEIINPGALPIATVIVPRGLKADAGAEEEAAPAVEEEAAE